MSVTAHYTEQFILAHHFPRLNFRWLIVGSAFPDAFVLDRIFMFTLDMKLHRDYGFGWLHTLSVPLLAAIGVWLLFGRMSGVSFLVGSWLHVLTDVFDELGVKLLWPFVDRRYSVGIWPWSDTNVLYDWYVYFTTPASGLFELLFLVWAILVVRGFKGDNFLRKAISPWKGSRWRDKAGGPPPLGSPGADVP